MHKYVVVKFNMPFDQTCVVLEDEKVDDLLAEVAELPLPEELAVRGCWLEAIAYEDPELTIRRG